jgi:Zn-dependent protease with chaperone function
MEYKVNPKENGYFAARVIVTLIVWYLVIRSFASLGSIGELGGATTIIMVFYAAFIALFFAFQKILIVAYLKGDGIAVSERQFPEVHARYLAMAAKLGIKKVPPLFILQQGGALNAFAIRFSRRNYVAVYSDVFATHESDPDALDFVLAHELGHVRRAHMSKAFWTLPSAVVPFLAPAWSRACEYTCDNVGASLTGAGKANGLALLAGGSDLYKRIDLPAYLESARLHRTGSVRFVGLFMSHPWLPARIENVRSQQYQ